MKTTFLLGLAAVALSACATSAPKTAFSDDPAKIETTAEKTLAEFLETHPDSQAIAEEAEAIMVFPSIVKGGFIYGGHYGRGALLHDGEETEFYSSAAASYGFQAGGQRFSYIMFFMNEDALDYLDNSNGFELGFGPSLTVFNQSIARSFTTSSLRSDIYVSIFDGRGLMAGGGIQGTKITPLTLEDGELRDAGEIGN